MSPMLDRKQSLRKPSFSPERKNNDWWTIEQPLRILPVLAKAVPPVGGLLVLLFFVSIKHFPELDLSGSIALLWAVAVVGGVIVLCIGLGAMLPSLMELASERSRATRDRQATQQILCALPGWIILLFFLLQSSGWVHHSMFEWSPDRLAFILGCMSVIVGGALARKEPPSTIAAGPPSPAKGLSNKRICRSGWLSRRRDAKSSTKRCAKAPSAKSEVARGLQWSVQ
ncbi:hypothetical protein D3C71_1244520 [compost metagenome]